MEVKKKAAPQKTAEHSKPKPSEKAAYDYQLIQRALKKGDQSAYAELMYRYKDSIYYMLLKMVNNRDDAEDLTIEAFGKAFKKLKQYTPDFAFSTWLFKIATNNCIDFIRKKKKMLIAYDRTITVNDGNEIVIEVKSEKPTPEEVLIKQQKEKIMREVVDQLKPRYRKLVELRYYKEYSYEEISEIMKLPLGTVKAQLFRAREFLYQIIANKPDEI
jgi:RNA polymerase sigma-70 factor (ECF subfamily)